MLTLLDQPDLIRSVWCTDEDLVVTLKDGHTVSAPLWWYPRLLKATPPQRAAVEIGRFGIHWKEIDRRGCRAGGPHGRRQGAGRRGTGRGLAPPRPFLAFPAAFA
jgi:hypothetical protein